MIFDDDIINNQAMYLTPKGYIADTGMACAAQAIASPNVLGGHPLFGPFFETAVAGELRKQCSLLSPRPNLYHWRSHGGAEVDFLLEYNGVFHPIEVKAATAVGRRDTMGIAAFRKTHPTLRIAAGLVLAPVDAIRQISDLDYAVPWDIGPAEGAGLQASGSNFAT